MVHYIITYLGLSLFGIGLAFMAFMIYRLAFKGKNKSTLLKGIFWGFSVVFIVPFLWLVIFLVDSDISEYIAQLENDSIRFGYINRTGKTVIPFQFNEAGSFENGYALVKKDNETYWIDSLGNRAKNQSLRYLNNPNQRGFYELIGGLCSTFDYENCREGEIKIKDSVSEGLNLVRLVKHKWISNNGFHYISVRWGFQDTTGRIVIPPIFLGAFSFREGLAAVIDTLQTPAKRLKMGYINHKGDYIIAPNYVSACNFNEGKAAVSIVTRK